MPRLIKAVPKYRKHRASGQAIVTINGRDHYLGIHNSKGSGRRAPVAAASERFGLVRIPPPRAGGGVIYDGEVPSG